MVENKHFLKKSVRGQTDRQFRAVGHRDRQWVDPTLKKRLTYRRSRVVPESENGQVGEFSYNLQIQNKIHTTINKQSRSIVNTNFCYTTSIDADIDD